MRHLLPSTFLVLFVCATAAGQTGVLYGVDLSSSQLGVIDRSTGAFTGIGGTGASPLTGLAYDSNQSVLYACSPGNNALYVVNEATGLATLVGPTGFSNVNALAHDPNANVLYSASLNGNSLFTINVATGAGTLIGTVAGASSIEGLAFDPATNTLYGLDDTVDKVVVIDPATAAATPLATTLGPGIWRGLDWDSELGVIWASKVNSGQLFQVAPATGAGLLIGNLPTFIQSLGFKPGLAQYQVNQAGASLTINGVQGTATSFAQVTVFAGQPATVALSSTNLGLPWEVGVGILPPISRSMGALVTSDDQLVNLDLSDPTLTVVWNQFVSPPFANAVLPVVFPFPGNLTVQMGVIDPGSPVGFSLSQPIRIVVQ
jgi:hypothetical protein